MTANKKAVQIFNKMFINQIDKRNPLSWELAKQCALIVVDEIIFTSMTGYLLNDSKVSEFQVKMRDYWQEVKSKIEKL